MLEQQQLDKLEEKASLWHAEAQHFPERSDSFITTSGVPIERLYSSVDTADIDYLHDLSFPGEYPFTRGIHHTGVGNLAGGA